MSESKLCPIPGCGAEMVESRHDDFCNWVLSRQVGACSGALPCNCGQAGILRCEHGDESSPYHQLAKRVAELEPAAETYFMLAEECSIPEGGSLVDFVHALKSDNAALQKRVVELMAWQESVTKAFSITEEQERSAGWVAAYAQDAMEGYKELISEARSDNAALRAQLEEAKRQAQLYKDGYEQGCKKFQAETLRTSQLARLLQFMFKVCEAEGCGIERSLKKCSKCEWMDKVAAFITIPAEIPDVREL